MAETTDAGRAFATPDTAGQRNHADQPNPTINILLATYNGERYLPELLDSLRAQTFADWEVLASDDDSSDGTVDVLRSYAQRDPRIKVASTGVAHGSACANFLSLIPRATAPYVAFCDQDDVWKPRKLEVTLARMREVEARHADAVPVAVYTDLEVVDERLEQISPSFMTLSHMDPYRLSLANVLVENKAAGCTMLVNRALYHDDFRLPERVEDVGMHDWWCVLIAAALGELAYLDEATIHYRQTGDNNVGVDAATVGGSVRRALRGANPFAKKAGEVREFATNAAAFAETYRTRLTHEQYRLCLGCGRLLARGRVARIAYCHQNDLLRTTPLKRLGVDLGLLACPRTR